MQLGLLLLRLACCSCPLRAAGAGQQLHKIPQTTDAVGSVRGAAAAAAGAGAAAAAMSSAVHHYQVHLYQQGDVELQEGGTPAHVVPTLLGSTVAKFIRRKYTLWIAWAGGSTVQDMIQEVSGMLNKGSL